MNDINGNLWQEAIDEQQNNERNGVLQQDLDAQRAMLADSENASRRDAQADAQKQIFIRNLMGTVVKRSGGGPISQRLANWANVALQKAGVKDMGIMAGGGFGDDGNFIVPTFSGVDQSGQPVPGSGVKYGPESIFSMMNQLRGIFSDSDRKVMADRLRDNGVGEEQIASMSFNPFETLMTDRERSRRSMSRPSTDPDSISNRMGVGDGGREVGSTATFKGADTRPRGVHAFSSDGKGGFSSSDWTPEGGETRRDWGTRDQNYKGRWKVRVNGPDGKVYENDKTGEEITVKPGENLRDVLMKSEKSEVKPGQVSGAGVEIAKINAASREKVAGMTTGSRERIAEGNNQTRKEIADAQISSREKIAEAANALKELGIDVSAALKERGYDLQEARDAETARHNRVGEETAERRADTQERRVEDQYELGDRKQTHNENRLEQDKAKSGRSADQRDAELAERKRQFDEREKRLSKPKDQGGTGEDSRNAVSAMKGMLELARTSGMSDEDLADLESWTNERIKGMAGMGGETSGDGGAKGKVKYTDLKPGQKFTMTDKDGKKSRCVKTEKGYKFID